MAGVTQTSREFNHPRITYHAENRTFDRLFKETSLAELKRVVQRKLGLSNNGVVLLSQIRSGKLIDLEDAHEATEATSPANSEDIPETAVNAGQKRKVVFDEGEHPSEHSAIPPSKRRRNNSTSVPKSQTGISQSISDEEVQQLSQPLPLPTTVEDTPTTTPEPTNNALPLPTPVPTQRPPAQPTEPVIGGTSSNAKEAEPKKSKSKKSADAVEEDELETNQDPKPTPGDKKKRKKKKKDVGSEDTLVESTTQSWNSKNKSKSKEAEAVNPFPQQLASVIDKSRVDAETQEVAKGGKPKKKSKKGDTEDGDTAQIGAKANDSNNATKTAATKVKDGAKTLAKSTKTRGRAPTETPESVVDPESREPPKKRARSASVAEISDARTTLLRFNEEMKKKRQANNMPSKATTSSTTPNISRSANPPVLQKKTNASARKKPAEPTEKATTQAVSPKPPIQSKPPVQPSTIRQPAAGNESDSDDSLRAMHATAHLAQQRRYTELLEKPSLDISIEDVMRGPHRRRLTVDNALRADIAGQRDTQDIELEEDQVEEFRDRRKPFGGRRARSSSDSEMEVDGDGGADETNDDVLASNTSSVPPIVQSASASSREDSPPSNAEHPAPIPVPAAPTEARSDISSSEVLVPETIPIADVIEAGVNTSVVPETPPPEDALPAVDGNAGTENSDAVAKSTPADDVDPIEPTVPTPREGSPIEPASQAPRGM
ncbi:hypothetical protein VNI00_004049 [Paramarasmius palmivorus]|uniref:Uncharacterized protein n=1 Tax=Paramarasmius palmivorus TaxID=297713 RepID=A0AAW0DN10_9AGAR